MPGPLIKVSFGQPKFGAQALLSRGQGLGLNTCESIDIYDSSSRKFSEWRSLKKKAEFAEMIILRVLSGFNWCLAIWSTCHLATYVWCTSLCWSMEIYDSMRSRFSNWQRKEWETKNLWKRKHTLQKWWNKTF